MKKGINREEEKNALLIEQRIISDSKIIKAFQKKEKKINQLKSFGIPVFMAVSEKGTGKTYFFDMIKEDLQKRGKRTLSLVGDGFSVAYVEKKIKNDKIEVILLDESEVIL